MKDPIDSSVLSEYLSENFSDFDRIVGVRQFHGGASNLTYEIDTGNQKLILRKPPSGTKAKSAHDMSREYNFQNALNGHYPVPKMLHLCENVEILGSEFYLMEKIDGLIPRKEFPKEFNLSRENVSSINTQFIDKLVELHTLDYQKIKLDSYFKGLGYVERQVNGWIERYRKAITPGVPDFKYITDWLRKEKPADLKPTIIHNDFRLDNIIFCENSPHEIEGVLDWEMATIGDPMMDLGNSLAYWIEAGDLSSLKLFRRQPSHVEGMMSRQSIIEYYQSKRGISLENSNFYYYFGIFRLAVIAQQIYYRYYHKQSQNKKFASFGVAVNLLHDYLFALIKNKPKGISGKSLTMIQNFKYLLRFGMKNITG